MEESELDEKSDLRNVPKHIIKEFINTYRAHPALWQIKNKEAYGNKQLKYKGYQALVQVWKKYDPDADIRMVKNKIQSLRGSFRKELKKFKNSLQSGSGTDDLYVSSLWYFSRMIFLTEHTQQIQSVDNSYLQELTHNSDTHQDSDFAETNNSLYERITHQETRVNSAITKNNKKYEPIKKKRKVEDEPQAFFKTCRCVGKNECTEDEIFGQFIGKKLNKVTNPEQKMYAETIITQVLNYAILGKLNEMTDIMRNSILLKDTKYITALTNNSSAKCSLAKNDIMTTTITVENPTTTEPGQSPRKETPPDMSANTYVSAYYENVAGYETIDAED